MTTADPSEFWDGVEDYERQVISLRHRPGYAAIEARISVAMPPGGAAADIGCGPGYFLPLLNPARAIYAVDWSEKMLLRARNRAPSHTAFVHMDAGELQLPEPLDFALCLNVLAPGNHSSALTFMSRLTSAVAPNGILMVVLPSMESLLYRANLEHFQTARDGSEGQSLNDRLDEFVQGFNNPLGYVKSDAGTVTKYWVAEEFEAAISLVADCRIEERFKVPVFWTDYSPETSWQPDFEPPWMWGWLVRMN